MFNKVKIIWLFMSSSLNSQMRLDDKLPIYEVSLTSSCQTTDGAKDFWISDSWRTVSSADWILNKLTLCSATAACKWSSQICLCEHNEYHEFIMLVVWKYFCKMKHPVAGWVWGLTAWADYVRVRYAKHQSCIFISWHLLTFYFFQFIQVRIM